MFDLLLDAHVQTDHKRKDFMPASFCLTGERLTACREAGFDPRTLPDIHCFSVCGAGKGATPVQPFYNL